MQPDVRVTRWCSSELPLTLHGQIEALLQLHQSVLHKLPSLFLCALFVARVAPVFCRLCDGESTSCCWSYQRVRPVAVLIDRNAVNHAPEQLWSKRPFGDDALHACDFCTCFQRCAPFCRCLSRVRANNRLFRRTFWLRRCEFTFATRAAVDKCWTSLELEEEPHKKSDPRII